MQWIGRALASAALVCSLHCLFTVPARSDLVFDGVPGEAGEAVRQATAEYLNSITWFFGALSRWEFEIQEDKSIDREEMISRSLAAFEEFSNLLSVAQDRFRTILEKNMVGLDTPLLDEGDERVRVAVEILKERGYSPPRGLVDIALSEVRNMTEASQKMGWSENVDNNRESAFIIIEHIRNSLKVGLALSLFVEPQQ